MVRISFFFIASNLNNAFKVYTISFLPLVRLNFVSFFFLFYFIHFHRMLGKKEIYIICVSRCEFKYWNTLLGKSKFYSSILAGGWTRLHSEDRVKKIYGFLIFFFCHTRVFHSILFYRLNLFVVYLCML